MSVSKAYPPSSDGSEEASVTVAAFYRYVEIPDPAALRRELLAWCRANGVLGTVLIAPEGINATVAGNGAAVPALLAHLRRERRFAGLDARLSHVEAAPFRRLEVRLRREIVSFGVAGLAPQVATGIRVAPADWNALISDPDVLVIDARNDYEIRLGGFERAHNPGTRRFREFPRYVARALDPATATRVAMFCTGGIRCEKASAYLLSRGFSDVYQLAGGILRYLEEVPAEQSKWRGECFVFDSRVAVDDALGAGQTVQCHACRQPLAPSELHSPKYEQGVSCPHCHDRLSPARRSAFRERRRQVALAAQRHQRHIGAVMADAPGCDGEKDGTVN